MSVTCDCRSVFRFSILFCLLLTSTCTAADLDIIFAGDFTNSQPIQWVRRHPRAGGASIALGPAFVTATRLAGGGNLTIYLQVPPELNGNDDYPQWSALKWFGSASGGVPAIGDCVYTEGIIALFNGATELAFAVWTAAPGTCGDAPITPAVPGLVESIATDTDLVTADNQAGVSAEAFESVLVRLNSVTVQTSNGGTGPFKIGDTASGPYLSVAGFMYQYTSVQDATLASITGILDEFDVSHDPDPPTKVYQLLPRGPSDIVQ